MAGINKLTLDTRPDVIATFKRQGTEASAIAVFERHLHEERRIRDLRAELQPAAERQALEETATATADVLRALDLATEAERRQVVAEIDVEEKGHAGAHVTTAAAVNLVRLRESDSPDEVRALLASARRAGPLVFDEALAIVRPRVRQEAARETGLKRSASGAPSVTSPWFVLLCELGAPGAPDARRRLDAVAARHAERKRQVLAAAAAVHADLPRLIQTAALRAAIPATH